LVGLDFARDLNVSFIAKIETPSKRIKYDYVRIDIYKPFDVADIVIYPFPDGATYHR
jgi:hypothetical protein